MKKKLLALLSALALCVGLMVPASAAGQTFTDVPSTYWAHDAIQYVTDEGLFQGTSATTFEPGTTMTRAMLIQVLFRYAGSPQLPDTWVFPYRDVPDDAYYWDAAFWGRHRNIFADEFVENCDALRPNEAVTRGEFATMLWKFAREVLGSESVAVGTVESGPFTDMDDGDPRRHDGCAAKHAGVGLSQWNFVRHLRHNNVPERARDPCSGGDHADALRQGIQ